MPSNLFNTVRVSIFLLMTGFCFNGLSQQNIPITEFQDKILSQVFDKVDSLCSTDFLLKNGRYYMPEFPRSKGHPFLKSNEWNNSNLTLLDWKYYNMKLLYDVFRDNLICKITLLKNEEIPIILNREIVNRFNIDNQSFINANILGCDDLHGFYEVIYEGKKVKAYAKWSKDFINTYDINFNGEFYKEKRKLFVLKNDKAIEVNKKKDLIKAFSLDGKQNKTLMKINKIKLSKSDNYMLSQIFEYLDQLPQD